MLTRKSLFPLLALVFLIASCSEDRLNVDVSQVQLDLKFEDMNTSMYHLHGDKLMKKHQQYLKQIPEIYSYYLGACMEFREGYSDSTYLSAMTAFQNDKQIKPFQAEIDKAYSNLKPIETELTNGFKHLKYHLPQAKMPAHIVFMNSLLRSSVWCTENEIGIGLDRYLGANSPTIKKLNPSVWYQWVKDGMNPDFMARDVVENWIQTHIVSESDGNLAEQMIRAGKVLYLTKAAFPEMEDYLILRYNTNQWKWAEKNRAGFWKYLVDNSALFKSEEITRLNLMNPGPKTAGIPIEGSPDRLGQYLGFKMVLYYMENNETAVKDLIDLPYNTILQAYEIEE